MNAIQAVSVEKQNRHFYSFKVALSEENIFWTMQKTDPYLTSSVFALALLCVTKLNQTHTLTSPHKIKSKSPSPPW